MRRLREYFKQPIWRAVHTDDVLTLGQCIQLCIYTWIGCYVVVYAICKLIFKGVYLLIDKINSETEDEDSEE